MKIIFSRIQKLFWDFSKEKFFDVFVMCLGVWYTCIYVHMWTGMCVYTQVKGRCQKPYSVDLHFIFSHRVSHWTWRSLAGLLSDWVSSWPLSLPPRTGITGEHHHAQLFLWVLWTWTQVFMIVQHAFLPTDSFP